MTWTTRDLLEQASLDALGMLDEVEREEFERSFRASSPEVQAMIRREQTRVTDLNDLLPRVEAPVGLKSKVVSAWREAVAAVAPETAGTIGPAVPALQVGLRTGYVWRAACMAFASATLVLAGFFTWGMQMNRDLRTQLAQNETMSELSNFGPGFLNHFFSGTKREYALAPQVEGLAAGVEGRLIIDDEKGTGVLVFQRLPSDEGAYRVVLEAPGGGQIVSNFRATGGVTTVALDLAKFGGKEALKSLDKLAIIGPTAAGGTDQIIFRVKLA